MSRLRRSCARQFYQRLTEVPFDDGDALYSLRLRAERARTVAESKRRKRKARSEDFVWERARGGAPELRVRLYELRQLLSMREESVDPPGTGHSPGCIVVMTAFAASPTHCRRERLRGSFCSARIAMTGMRPAEGGLKLIAQFLDILRARRTLMLSARHARD